MPRIRKRRRKGGSDNLNFYQLACLLIGWRDPAKWTHLPRQQIGYRNIGACKLGWEKHKHNPRVSYWKNPNDEDYRPGRRPWAWWKFESKKERDRSRPQWEQLFEMGVLEEHELEELPRLRRRNDFVNPTKPPSYADSPTKVTTAKVKKLRKEATEKVKNEPWFQHIVDKDGLVTAADADAIINHGCYLDLEIGYHMIDFMETFCHPSESDDYLLLMYWQSNGLIMPLFGWQRPDGSRRFREAYIHIAKKNGKSMLLSAVGCYGGLLDGELGPKIYSTALKREQAGIVHGEISAMVKASPELFRVLKPVDSQWKIHLRGKKTSIIEALTADSESNEGWKTYYLMSDELHAWKDRKFYNTLRFGTKGRRQPLRLAISTAGDDKASLGGEKYEYACKIRDGLAFNYAFMALIYEPPSDIDLDKPENYLNRDNWIAANPALGLTVSFDEFETELLTAREESEHSWATFLRYNFNIWIGSTNPWVPMHHWKKCIRKFSEEDFEGKPCWAGLDLSSTSDITALMLVFPEQETGLYYVVCRLWVPEKRVKEVSEKSLAKYDKWVRTGDLLTMPGEVIDEDVVMDEIKEVMQRFRIQNLRYDRWGSRNIAKKLDEMGLEVIPFGQGYKDMTQPTKTLEKMIKTHTLAVDNECLTWQAGNVTVSRDTADGIKMVKEPRGGGKHKKIDGMVGLAMAIDGATDAGETESAYEDADLLFM